MAGRGPVAKKCAKCGGENPDWASFCQRCGEYFPGAQGAPSVAGLGGSAPAATSPSSSPTSPYLPTYSQPAAHQLGQGRLASAALLLIASGLLAAASIALALAFPQTFGGGDTSTVLTPAELALTIMSIAVTPMPVVAGILAYQKSNWKLAVGCAALGLLTIGFFFLSSMLSFIGLMMIVRRRGSFTS